MVKPKESSRSSRASESEDKILYKKIKHGECSVETGNPTRFNNMLAGCGVGREEGIRKAFGKIH